MKRYLLLIILLLIPFVVQAEDFEYTIKSKVTLEGKELEGNDFTFDLIDVDDNIIQTTTNDTEGNIIFEPISFENEFAGYEPLTNGRYLKYYFFTIKQRNEESEGITYDEETAYVGVYVYSDGTSTVDYLKDIEKIKKETTEYKTKAGTIYHATEEELQGEAYAVYDSSTNILTFFRDEAGKYTDKQVEGTKTYYTGFEKGDYYPAWQYWYSYYHYGLQAMTGYWQGNANIKKIVFEDPIKPKYIANVNGGTSWFSDMDNLEEIENINLLDTSEVTSFRYLFESDVKLTSLDLTSWDTSKVTDMYMMFANCYNLEEVYIDNFDTSNVTNISYMFEYTYKLEWVNQKVFNLPKLRNSDLLFFNSKLIKGLDTSSWNIQDKMATAEIAYYMDSLVYLNVSTLPGLWSEAISNDQKLAILDLAGEYEVMYTNIGVNGVYWYNTKNHTLYNREEIINHLTVEKDLEPATYVRPNNNPEPPVFRNTYVEEVTEEVLENTEENIPNNPITKDGVVLVLLITLLVGLLTLSCYKKYKFYN